jgi:hypothetical protein
METTIRWFIFAKPKLSLISSVLGGIRWSGDGVLIKQLAAVVACVGFGLKFLPEITHATTSLVARALLSTVFVEPRFRSIPWRLWGELIGAGRH